MKMTDALGRVRINGTQSEPFAVDKCLRQCVTFSAISLQYTTKRSSKTGGRHKKWNDLSKCIRFFIFSGNTDCHVTSHLFLFFILC